MPTTPRALVSDRRDPPAARALTATRAPAAALALSVMALATLAAPSPGNAQTTRAQTSQAQTSQAQTQPKWRLHTLGAVQFQTPRDWRVRRSGTAPSRTNLVVEGQGAAAPRLALTIAPQPDLSRNAITGLITASRARVANLPATRYDWRRNGRRGITLVFDEPTPSGKPLTVVFTSPGDDWIAMRPVFERATRSIRFTVKTAEQTAVRPPEAPAPARPAATAARPAQASAPTRQSTQQPEQATRPASPAQTPAAAVATPVPQATTVATPTKAEAEIAPTSAEAPKKTATPPKAVVPTKTSTPKATVATAAPPRAAPVKVASAPATQPAARTDLRPVAELGWSLRVPDGWSVVSDNRFGVESWRLRRDGWRAGRDPNGLYAVTVTLTPDNGETALGIVAAEAIKQLSKAAFGGATAVRQAPASLGGAQGLLADITPAGSESENAKRLRLFLARDEGRLIIVTALAEARSSAPLEAAFGRTGIVTARLKEIPASVVAPAESSAQ